MSNAVQYHIGKFPPIDSNLDWQKLIPLIGPANAALAKYDGTLAAIPNAAVLLSPLTTQEAVLSSRIEGTQASMAEVFEYEAEEGVADIPDDRKNDIDEILNYRNALIHALELLVDLPLCQRVFKETHRVLLDGVRGHGKSPGEYRRTPNWIGTPGCTIEEARFVPISAEQLPEAMSTWEKYIHEENVLDRLVQLAVIHAEFEALHPFLDGNGRLGRMSIPLFMFKTGLIQSPMFYISAFFEANRDVYYEKLLAISRDNDWTGWCEFFLQAVTTQAQENQEKAEAILSLYNHLKIRISELTRSQYSIRALDFIFKRPVFRSSEIAKHSGIPEPTAKRILALLRKESILIVIRKSRGSRAARYAFKDLLNAAEGYKAF